jgi:hypothetical protein
MKEVHKLDMAVEQLEDALKVYFEGRFHSAIVLAGAAEQLLAGHVLKNKMKPAWSQMRSAVTKIANGLEQQKTGKPGTTTEDQIGALMNRAYNHSKHAGTKDHAVYMNPKFEARELIDRTISNYDALFGLRDYDLPQIQLSQRFIQESLDEAQISSDAQELLAPVAGDSEA